MDPAFGDLLRSDLRDRKAYAAGKRRITQAQLRTRSHSVIGLAVSDSSLSPAADPDGRQQRTRRKIEQPEESGMLT
jgi:hypothetical protein